MNDLESFSEHENRQRDVSLGERRNSPGKNDVERELLERGSEPVDGSIRLSRSDDLYSLNLKRLILSGQEIREEYSERIGAGLARSSNDRSSELGGSDGERSESESRTFDRSNFEKSLRQPNSQFED